MDVRAVNKVNEALNNIRKAIELEMCVLDIKDRPEYEVYFKKIEESVVKVVDDFYKDWIHKAQVIKN